MSDLLREAQMHAECMNEALFELFHRHPSTDRVRVIEAELKARVWAVIYLMQAHGGWEMTEAARQTIREANAHNGPAEEFDVPMLGIH